MHLFQVTPVDHHAGMDGEDDFCARGADAYTSNGDTTINGVVQSWALCHFCPKAFDVDQAMRLGDLKCSDFEFNGRYRVTNEMDSLTPEQVRWFQS